MHFLVNWPMATIGHSTGPFIFFDVVVSDELAVVWQSQWLLADQYAFTFIDGILSITF